MADEQQSDEDDMVHYEGGIPVFKRRLDNLEDEARKAKERDDQYKDEQLRLNRRLVWFTGLLAAVGLIGSAISGYQAHVAKINADAARDNASAAEGMVEEMKHAREQATMDSAKAVATQQQIAQDSLMKSQANFDKSSQNAADTFRDEQRAWVGAVTVTDMVLKEGEFPSYTVILTNSGKTPALHMHAINMHKSWIKGKVIEFDYPNMIPGQILSDTVLQPGANSLLHSLPAQSGKLTKTQVDSITSGDYWWWVYGKLSYEDVSRRRHNTKFCFVITPDLKSAQPCSTYNEAD